MKMRNRLLAMLMAFAMVLAYMPAVAFAESEEPADADSTTTAEESIMDSWPGESLKKDAAQYEESDPEIYDIEMSLSRTDLELFETETYDPDDNTWNYPLYFDEGDKLRVYTNSTDYDDYVYTGYTDYEGGYIFENPDREDITVYTWWCSYYDEERVVAGETYEFNAEYDSVYGYGEFSIEVTVTKGDEEAAAEQKALNDAKKAAINELLTLADQKYSQCRDAQKAELENAFYKAVDAIDEATSIAGINSALAAGKNAIAAIKTDAQLRAEEAARAAAAAAAAAEAARQGAVVGGLPKVKIAKPAAAKGSANIKWKKLTKKQLKGITNIEVWVCPNTGFGADTIMKLTGKKKASLKVKGLAKGTYYVKVRAINNAGGVKYYTSWSKVKKVKVK